MEEEKELLPAWMRYMPRTGWISSSQEVNTLGNAASTKAVKSSCKFSTTEVTIKHSRAKNSSKNVAYKSQSGKMKKKLSASDKSPVPKAVSSASLKERRKQKYGSVNISEISELVSMSKLSN